MPRVAIADNVVPLAQATAAKFQPVDNGGGLGGAIGAGLRELGHAGAGLADQETASQVVYDEAAIKQGLNTVAPKVRDTLYTGPDAFFNLRGAAAVDAQKPATEAIAQIRAATLASLKNDRQKRLFSQTFDATYGPDYERMATHANRELVTYGAAQSQARQDSAANDAILNADDTTRFAQFVATGNGEIIAAGKLTGWSPEVIAEKQKEYVSGIHTRIIDGKMTADPVGAATYADAHRDEIQPGDMLKIKKALYEPLMERQASADVDGLMGGASGALKPNAVTQTAPTPTTGSTAARMQAITAFSESRGRERNADGSIVTSSAGAQGKMQVMPGTNANPGFGVRPAADNSDAERTRVGQDYLAAMMRRYSGDPAKAWAAYNAGPGRVDQAVAAKGDAWLTALPQETKDYVHTNVAALGGKAPGDQSGIAPARDDLGNLYSAIDRQPWDFERKKLAKQEVDRRVSRDDHIRTRAQDDAKDQAFDVIGRLGDGFTSINQLPANVRDSLSPEVRYSLQQKAEQNASPKAIDAHGEVAIQLNELAATNPDAFIHKDLRLFQSKMTPGEYEEMRVAQAKMLAKPTERTDYSKIWGAVSHYGGDAGLDMAPQKKPNESDEQFQQRRKDGFTVFKLMQGTLDTVTQGKRQPTDQEVKAAFDNAVMSTTITQPGRLWGTNTTVVPRYKNPNASPTGVAVPNVEMAQIRAQLRAANQPYDDGTVARIYFQRQAAKN